MSGVMEGIKVIELGAWVAGPGAGAVLGDWGAEVIKIEDPLYLSCLLETSYYF